MLSNGDANDIKEKITFTKHQHDCITIQIHKLKLSFIRYNLNLIARSGKRTILLEELLLEQNYSDFLCVLFRAFFEFFGS